jgi:hypothetical protein
MGHSSMQTMHQCPQLLAYAILQLEQGVPLPVLHHMVVQLRQQGMILLNQLLAVPPVVPQLLQQGFQPLPWAYIMLKPQQLPGHSCRQQLQPAALSYSLQATCRP